MSDQFTRPTSEIELNEILRKAASLASKNQYDEALAICDFLVEDDSTKAAGLRERASIKEQAGDAQGAIDALYELLALGQNEPADLHQLGVITLSLGRFLEVIDFLSQAIDIGKKENIHYYTNSCYLHRAEAFLRLSDLASAEADCAKLPRGYKAYIFGIGMRSKEQIEADVAAKKGYS